MRIFPGLLRAVAAATMATAAHSDELSTSPPGQDVAANEFGSGWYLRGDIGRVDYVPPKQGRAVGAVGSPLVGLKFDKTFSIGGGIGYRFNRFLRFDVTADYRGETRFMDRSSRTNFAEGFNEETGKFSAIVALANVYADLGTWYGLTPYVGAGVGVARQGFRGFFSETTCTTVTCGDPAVVHVIGLQGDKVFRPNRTGTTLAWALMGGISTDIGRGFSLDTGYRYLNAGHARSAIDAYGFDTRLKDIKSHEVRVGLRYPLH